MLGLDEKSSQVANLIKMASADGNVNYFEDMFIKLIVAKLGVTPKEFKYVIDNLGLKYDGTEKFEKGRKYLNNIIPDFKITKNNEIIALVECKGANINVTDYVRGLGQLAQYESFWEKNIKCLDLMSLPQSRLRAAGKNTF